MRPEWTRTENLRRWPGLRSLSLGALGFMCLLSACSSGDSGGGRSDPNPAPAITLLSPSSTIAGSAAFSLTVTGTNFLPASVVQWKGNARTTTFVNTTQLVATIFAADIASAGTANITVFSPSPGGGTSSPATFTIGSNIITISSLAPTTAAAGSAPFTLTVTGTNFIPSSTVRWNGSNRSTTFISGTQLTAAIPSGDVATPGTAQVTVESPNGGLSGATAVPITAAQAPVPTITSLAPASVAAGITGFALTVNGTGLVAGTVAQWNGASRATVVLSSTQLMIAPLPADNAVAGNASVGLLNPAPGGLSSSLGVTVSALAPDAIGVTDRLSVAGDSAEANGDSLAVAISADGRFVAFASSASNLVPGDTNTFQDAFLRDTCRGIPAGCTPSIARISVANDGSQGNAATGYVHAVSANGRFIVFLSSATNLVPGDTNAIEDIFLRDTCLGASGCTPSTLLVSVASGGGPATAAVRAPAISADGRYVVFESAATDLVPGDTNGADDVFLRDTCAGTGSCTPSTIRVSVATDGSQVARNSYGASISANGRWVSFASPAIDLVADDTNDRDDIFIRDTCIAASGCTPATVRVSVDSAGAQADQSSFLPRISSTGRHVVFSSFATNLFPNDTGNTHDVFVRDTCFGAAGGCTP
ncbi:MAG: hypothetical protein RL030_928, partial [Pseudomonadota bacterium]